MARPAASSTPPAPSPGEPALRCRGRRPGRLPAHPAHQVTHSDDRLRGNRYGQVARGSREVGGDAAFLDAAKLVTGGYADVATGCHYVHQIRAENPPQCCRLDELVRQPRRVGLEAHEASAGVDDPGNRWRADRYAQRFE